MRHALFRTKITALIISLFILFTNKEVMAGPEEAFPPMALLAFGDDLTSGYGLPPSATFSGQLEAALRERGYNVSVILQSIPGDTTWSGYARLEWTLLIRPPVNGVILELGINDMLQGIHPDKTKKNLGKIMEILKEYNLPVLLAGIKPPPAGRAQAEVYEKIYRELAEEYGAVYEPDFLAGSEPQDVAALVNHILPSVLELLGKQGATQ